MEIQKTQRGFEFIEFNDIYNKSCCLQKSSLATEDAIWLGISNPEIKILASKICEDKNVTGWANFPLPEGVEVFSRMHLSQEQVKELLPYLIKFAETGELT